MALGLASCGGGGGGASTDHGSSRHESGEESVEDFGEEAVGADREQILSAERAYLEAIASHDYATACAKLSGRAQKALGSLTRKQAKPDACEEILPAVLAPTAARISRQQARGRVTKVRVNGKQALILFRAPGARLYVLTLVREGGDWKSSNLSASILVPDPASIGAAR